MTGGIIAASSLLGAAKGGFALPHINYTAILPELICLGGALLLITAGALRVGQIATSIYTVLTVAISGAALVASVVLWNDVTRRGGFTTIAHSLAIDGFSIAFLILSCSILVVGALAADGYLQREGFVGPEYHALALLGASGAMFMAAANDLIIIFLALEIMSLPLYILAGLDHRRSESGEAAMKYFLLGAFSSAIFVYGISLVYGATGSTNLASIASYLAANVLSNEGLLLAGAGLLLVGFCFKIAAVPFHMWSPDVYQGAPSPATGFMAAIAKVGGFAALLRVFFSTFHSIAPAWQPIIWVIAILTMVLGAVLGLVQRDIKRMLAYSSINHAGFILLGLQAATRSGIAASLYYVFAYSFLIIGSFTVIAVIGQRVERHNDIADYRGLGRRQPVLALAFAILLLAQAGVPFTTGFLSKLYVVEASVQAHSYALAVVAMLSGAVAAVYYLRVVFLMYGTGDLADAHLGRERPQAGEPAIEGAGTAGVTGSVVMEPAMAAAGSSGVSSAAGTSDPSQVFPSTVGAGVAGTARSAAANVAATDPIAAETASSVPDGALPGGRYALSSGTQLALLLTVGFTLVLGIWPAPLFDLAHAASLLF